MAGIIVQHITAQQPSKVNFAWKMNWISRKINLTWFNPLAATNKFQQKIAKDENFFMRNILSCIENLNFRLASSCFWIIFITMSLLKAFPFLKLQNCWKIEEFSSYKTLWMNNYFSLFRHFANKHSIRQLTLWAVV